MQTFHRFLFVSVLLILVCFAILAVAYVGENRRGAAEWAAAQRELRAKGETLAWSDFIPPPVRASENLAYAPFYVRILAYAPDPQAGFYTFGSPAALVAAREKTPFTFTRPYSIPPPTRNPLARTDLATYAKFFRAAPEFPHAREPAEPAAEVLAALERFAPALDELARAAAERPRTRSPVNWHVHNLFQLRFDHENVQQQLVTTLSLRASARLAAGQAADALRDLQLGFRLCRDLEEEPALLPLLVQNSRLRTLLVPVREGLADRRWSAAELAVLQAELGRFDLLASYRQAIRGERVAFGVAGIDYLAAHLGEWPALRSFGMPVPAAKRYLFQFTGSVAPRGWFDANRATYVRFTQTHYVEGVDPAAHRVFPGRFDGALPALAALPSGPRTFFVKDELMAVYASAAIQVARVQANLDAAFVACALERFHLDHAAYPAALAELVPTYLDRLPTDLVDGSPLHYLHPDADHYRLYEIGWNGRDDGGTVAWYRSGNSTDDKAGDWVWQYEPLSAPAGK